MTAIEVFGLYVGLFGLLFIILKGNVGRLRVQKRVDLGDGGHDPVYRAIRAQGNAVEDVPIFLIGLGTLALLGASPLHIHILGGAMLLGRVLHAAGITQMPGLGWGRLVGTVLTVFTKLGTVGSVFWHVMA
ncbi:MAG: hypothetical protein CMK09_09235 [Ponticaulis sp.]|nr:hypothetical protein [Ponticaulis sp.]|tara:strand:+ start:12665 stop:13057 length:393 start_codon:yes stop_codon:yes gene_type:complete